MSDSANSRDSPPIAAPLEAADRKTGCNTPESIGIEDPVLQRRRVLGHESGVVLIRVRLTWLGRDSRFRGKADDAMRLPPLLDQFLGALSVNARRHRRDGRVFEE
jgi:hypothetical protein